MPTRVRAHPRRGTHGVRPHFRNARPEDQRAFENMRSVNAGAYGEQLRRLMGNVAAEFSPSGKSVAVAEVSHTSDGSCQLTVMDPRTGYFRAFHIGCKGPADRIAFAINSGMKVDLPDGYTVEARV